MYLVAKRRQRTGTISPPILPTKPPVTGLRMVPVSPAYPSPVADVFAVEKLDCRQGRAMAYKNAVSAFLDRWLSKAEIAPSAAL
jgi:hypothetical protein